MQTITGAINAANRHKLFWKWNFPEQDYALNLVELEECRFLRAAFGEQSDQFEYIMCPGQVERNLDKLNETIHRKCTELVNRKSVIFHHENARPYTLLQTQKNYYKTELGCLTAFFVFIWPCFFKLPPISLLLKFLE